MPLVRGHHDFDDHYTQIPNTWVRDSRLTLKARGLLAVLMSHRPGWNMSVRSIARANGVGVDTVKSAVEELEKHGYLIRSADQKRTDGGTFADFEWVTSDPYRNPVTVEYRHGETAHKEEHPLKKNIEIEDNPQAELEESFLEFWQSYPRKVEKIDARKAFDKMAKTVAVETIVEGARRLAADPNLPAKQFIPYPASWLRAGGWESEPYPERELTADEQLAAQRAQAARRREIELAESRRLREESEAARKAAELNPPQRCEHDRIIYVCKVCSKRVATGNA